MNIIGGILYVGMLNIIRGEFDSKIGIKRSDFSS